eukprot:76966_1
MDPDVVLCSEGHSMSELHVEGMDGDNFTHECSMCKQAIIQEKLPYSCDLCNYYLCIHCLSSIQSTQWTQQNDMKAELISKAKPRKIKMRFDKSLTSLITYSPITYLHQMTNIYPKYWYKSTTFVVKIIEDAMFDKWRGATCQHEQLNIKMKKRSINYHKLNKKLYKYSCEHQWCSGQLLNVLLLFGFRVNGPMQSKDTRLVWNKYIDQGFHPQMCAIYCQLKNMLHQNWKINNITDGDAIFYNELIINPMSFIINRYCDIVTNDIVCRDISTLIYAYAFKTYKVMKCMDTFPASFIKNLQYLQDPQQFNSVIMCIGDQRYLYINIAPFERPNGSNWSKVRDLETYCNDNDSFDSDDLFD